MGTHLFAFTESSREQIKNPSVRVMKLIFALAAATAVSAATLEKDEAHQFLHRQRRVANMFWEYKESPWEQALEYLRDHRKEFPERHYDDFKKMRQDIRRQV